MARKRYSDEDVLKLLRQIELGLASGSSVEMACRSGGGVLGCGSVIGRQDTILFIGHLQRLPNIAFQAAIVTARSRHFKVDTVLL